jgi:hypothetical protein
MRGTDLHALDHGNREFDRHQFILDGPDGIGIHVEIGSIKIYFSAHMMDCRV